MHSNQKLPKKANKTKKKVKPQKTKWVVFFTNLGLKKIFGKKYFSKNRVEKNTVQKPRLFSNPGDNITTTTKCLKDINMKNFLFALKRPKLTTSVGLACLI